MELEQFLNSTSNSTSITSSIVPGKLTYPFIYLDSATTVEIKYWTANKVITSMQQKDTDIQVMVLCGKGYKLLGYSELCFTNLIKFNILKEHNIVIKYSKEEMVPIDDLFIAKLILSR